MRKLGLIGGLGPGATLHYYRELTKADPGEMLLVHADMRHALTFVERGDRTGLAGYFARLIERLQKGGAEVAAISAVTPHICIRELEKLSALPLVSIIDTTRAAILDRGFRRVALFGTRFVVESRMFGMLDGIEVIDSGEVDTIHRAYMSTVEGATDGRAELVRIARGLPVDAVVLAGTDLALIFDEASAGFPCVDSAKAHIEALLRG